MGNETSTEATKVEDYKDIDSRCIVKFRPADDWKGEYGFDWFREGDYGEELNNNGGRKFSHYENDNVVGRYFGEIYLCRYGNLDILHNKDEFTDSNNNTLYLASILYQSKRFFYSKSICATCPSYNNNSCSRNLYYNPEEAMASAGTPVKVDPDISEKALVHSPSFEFDKKEASGKSIPKFYEKELKKKYTPIPIKNKSNNYYVPTINLLYEGAGCVEKTVKLLIHAKDILSIEFVVEEGTRGIILNPIGILGINNGDLEHKLKISITSEFATNTKDVSIRAIATHKKGVISTLFDGDLEKTLAGKINILKYEPKYINVVIVPIFVDNHVPSNLNDMLEEEKKRLEKFFSQAQIVPLVDTNKPINDQKSLRMIKTLIDAASDYGRDRLGHPVRILVKTVTVRNTTFDGQVITSGTSLHVEFEKLFLGEPYDDNIKNAYKVFYILKEGNCAGQTAGFPNDTPKPPKNVIVFEPHRDETASHELFHRLGLRHSFANLSSYTFQKYSTSNIMDYAISTGLKRLSLWKWQWDEIRKQLDEDKKQEQEYNIT